MIELMHVQCTYMMTFSSNILARLIGGGKGGRYMKDGTCMAKNDIDGTLNVTSIIVMSTLMIKKSVMRAKKSAVIECNSVTTNIRCYRLIMPAISNTCRGLILFTQTYILLLV